MAIEIRETTSPFESKKDIWSQIAIALQPIVENLPKEEDREEFMGIMNLLIGKEPRISNIPEKLIYVMVDKGYDIAMLYKYYHQGIWSIEDIRCRLIQYLNELATYLSREGDLMKYGFGGWSRQFQEQKVITEDHSQTQSKKGFWSRFF